MSIPESVLSYINDRSRKREIQIANQDIVDGINSWLEEYGQTAVYREESNLPLDQINDSNILCINRLILGNESGERLIRTQIILRGGRTQTNLQLIYPFDGDISETCGFTAFRKSPHRRIEGRTGFFRSWEELTGLIDQEKSPYSGETSQLPLV